MKTQRQRSLEKGQIWKTKVAAIEVVALGQRFVHYKVTKQWGSRRVSSQVSGIEAMESYLQTNEAQLVQEVSRN